MTQPEARPSASRRWSMATGLGGLVLGIAGLVAALNGPVRAAPTPPYGSDLAFKAFAPAVANDVPRQCGVERWPVKTLSDADVLSVNFNPVATTVDALRALPKPSSYPDNARIGAVERTTYAVQATLVEMKREDDRDIHLVVADPSDPAHTMIVELVDISCEGAFDSPYRGQMESARLAFEAACGAPTTAFKALSGTATLTGVGFFDVIHGQRGVAPNGIELHPIIDVSSITCSVVGTPTPTSSPTATPTATNTPTPTPTATPTVATCGAAIATVTALDKSAEIVTVSGTGNLSGWYVISEAGNQRFNFPTGFVADGAVQIRSGVPQFANSSASLWWTAANVWNNGSDDDALLYDCTDQLRSTFEDGVP